MEEKIIDAKEELHNIEILPLILKTKILIAAAFLLFEYYNASSARGTNVNSK